MAVKQDRKRRRGNRGSFAKGDARINRAGRPRLAESLAEAIRAAGDEMIGDETRRDRVIRALWERCEVDRDVAALLFNRGWGRAVADEELLKRIDALESALLQRRDARTG